MLLLLSLGVAQLLPEDNIVCIAHHEGLVEEICRVARVIVGALPCQPIHVLLEHKFIITLMAIITADIRLGYLAISELIFLHFLQILLVLGCIGSQFQLFQSIVLFIVIRFLKKSLFSLDPLGVLC